ncbi:hypothetical protein [Archangium sp.]|uniref:hypothetical protein n=1 Tax=Archangium sp. TaxID=1872627 RepID=UPI002D2E5D25|nr:hypothetical protein [Archangium sp.]HYO58102.1 hypothetical protein [Archangium sp.]
MKKNLKSVGMGMFLSVALLTGCPGPETQDPDPIVSERCGETTADYLAFDVTNHAAQDERLKAIDEMVAMYGVAESDPTKAAAQAAAVLAKYQDPTTNLQAKVKGREDKHFTGDAAAVGPALDATTLAAIEDLKNAKTKLQVSLAKQRFQKAGMYRFLYLSVMEELYEPSYKHYDEAYGYLGTGPSNAEAGRRGLSKLATGRDGNNQTTLAAELFALMKEGSCTIETALKAKNADSMAAHTDDQNYARFVQSVDDKLMIVFAYSVGHELFDIDLNKEKPDPAYIKLVEGEGFFQTMEPYMKQAPAGSAKAVLAAKLRAAFNSAMEKAKNNDTTWITDIKATELLGEIEAAYGIDVKA